MLFVGEEAGEHPSSDKQLAPGESADRARDSSDIPRPGHQLLHRPSIRHQTAPRFEEIHHSDSSHR